MTMPTNKQFPEVASRFGAPMGRNTSKLGETKVRLFKVRLDSQGYDDGGAYWGTGQPLYCAQCGEGGQQFVRASNRLVAAAILEIPNDNLIQKIPIDDIAAYFRSYHENLMPPSLAHAAEWELWFDLNDFHVFGGE